MFVRRGKVPISEFGASNYTTAAFPTLFPFGRGDEGCASTNFIASAAMYGMGPR